VKPSFSYSGLPFGEACRVTLAAPFERAKSMTVFISSEAIPPRRCCGSTYTFMIKPCGREVIKDAVGAVARRHFVEAHHGAVASQSVAQPVDVTCEETVPRR